MQKGNSMKNLAVIFPGIGYTTEKPLLYYAKKIAEQLECEVVEISYGTLPADTDRMKIYDYAMVAANAAVNKISFEQYDKLFFISKSLGTAIAGTIHNNLNREVNHIFFTPVDESISYICEDSLVFTSNADPLLHIADVVKHREEVQFELYVAKEANHSLETGDILHDISALRKVEELCMEYMKKRI